MTGTPVTDVDDLSLAGNQEKVAAPPPADPARLARARAAAARVYAEEGAVRAEPALVQPADLFLELSGEDVRARLVLLEALGDADRLCLRPDLTIPVSLGFAATHASDARAIYHYDALVFRLLRGNGTPIQIRQVGQERFNAGPAIEEDVHICAQALEAVRGGDGQITGMMLSDAGVFARFVDGLGLREGLAHQVKRAFAHPKAFVALTKRAASPNPLARALSAVSHDEAVAALDEVLALAGVEVVGGRPASAVVERLLDQAADARVAREHAAAVDLALAFARIDAVPHAALDEAVGLARRAGIDLDGWRDDWDTRLKGLREAGAPLEKAVFSMGFARQFDYYDGAVFELRDAGLGPARQAIAGGGRYDSLLARLVPDTVSGPVPSLGSMVRVVRVAASAQAAS